MGANVGGLTRYFCEAGGPSARVYAIEPHPGTVLLAGEECKTWWTPQCASPCWFTMALGSKDDAFATLYLSDAPSRNSLYRANTVEPRGAMFPVPMRTLDSLQESGELPAHIDLIKIDAQGAELEILRGAKKLLAAGKTIWVMELWPEGLANAYGGVDAVIRLLERSGHEPFETTWKDLAIDVRGHTGHSAMDFMALPKHS